MLDTPLWVIPYMIRSFREVTNIVGVSYSYFVVETWIFSIRSYSDVWQIFSIDEGVSCWFIVDKKPNFINTRFYCSSQDGTPHTYYAGIAFVTREQFLDFIYDGLHLQILLIMIYKKTWSQEMGYHPIIQWGFPSRDCMINPQHSPMFFVVLLHRGDFSIYNIFPEHSLLRVSGLHW